MLNECYSLSRVFKKINPDIIHSYHYADDYTEPIAAKMAGIKWIYTKKNMSWKGPPYRGWKLRSYLANGIICQNKTMLKNFFPNWNKATLLPIGVDSEEYKSQPRDKDLQKYWGILDTDRIIITIANLVPVKGIEILIRRRKRKCETRLARDEPRRETTYSDRPRRHHIFWLAREVRNRGKTE